MRSLLCLLSVALFVPLLGTATPTVTQMSPYLHAQRLVDVGGRRLNLYCSGVGSPTVILDAGLGDTMESWYEVQPAVAKWTRVCSYDRAGMGFSDGTMTKRDPDAVVADLHVLLKRGGVRPPYILVGHSIAGLYEVLYANRYPDEVVGMVAVDPSRPFQWQRFLAAAPAMARLMDGIPQQYQRCYVALAHGAHVANELKPCGFETARQLDRDCATGGRGLCAVDRLQDRQAHNPLYWYDQLGELHAIAPGGNGSREVQATQRSYGAMPLIVLTADDGPHHDRGFPPTVPKAQIAAQWSVWKTMHDELAAYASGGVNFVVRDTGHYIQQNQPTAVISAITEVIAQSRGRSGRP
jgi:pimeloyl-ACP methyl ester carboxylesterase